MTEIKKGKVIFIGAGPGDPELITVKAANYLRTADVVLTDRLVSQHIIDTYCSPEALVIPVGKQCRRGSSTPQATINELMSKYAGDGHLVARLKGGDVSIFSNILDELITLSEQDIPYEIIPGITAAAGAAAYSGIPLTARNYATGVRLLTYYKSDVVSDAYWQDLAETDDTLVFYMSAETLPQVAEKLTSFKISPDKLLAVIEQATTPCQRISIYNLYDFIRNSVIHKLASPTLVIIGKVVSLHKQFGWVQDNENREEYFQPVGGTFVNIREENKNLLTA